MSPKSKVLTVLLVALVAALSPIVAEAQMRRPGPPPLLVVEGRASSDGTTQPLRIIVGPRPGMASAEGEESAERPPLGGVVFVGRHRPLLLGNVDCSWGTPVGRESAESADETTDTGEDADTSEDNSFDEGEVVTALGATVCRPPRRGQGEEELEVVGTLTLTIEPLTLDDGRVVPQVTGTLTITDAEGTERTFTIDGRPFMPGPRPVRRGTEEPASEPVEDNEAEQIEGDDVGSAVENF